MSGSRDWVARVRARLGPAAEEDVLRELADHAADRYREARADGSSEHEAEAAVGEEIEAWAREGSALRRRPRRPPLLETATGASALGGLGRDLHHAARALVRRPAHTLLVSLTMALGIGATTALFSVVHGVLLAPLPWPDADRLVRLGESREGAVRSWPWLFTNGSYEAWADEPATVDGLAGWTNDQVTLTEAGDPVRIGLTRVTASLFPLLGARPEIGDVFGGEAEREGGVVVLSEGLWRERFEARADTVGRLVRLDGEPHRILGIMPAEFAFPDREARAWAPLPMPPPGDRLSLFSAMARLRRGATPEQAAAEAEARAAAAPRPGMTERALFGVEGRPIVRVTPLVEALTQEVRPALLLLLAAVGLLLATATANVAGLQLTAATGRRRELALRSAVGAGRARLARLLLAENVLLGLLGGAGGLLLAAAVQRALPVLLPADFPRVDSIAIDGRVAAFAVLVSVGAGLAFGLLPALFAGRLRLTEVLVEDGAGSLGAGRSGAARVRAAILCGQVAAACVLLLGALQLGRSFFAQLGADRGYTTERLLVARLSLPDALYSEERREQLVTALLERIRAVPGVQHAAVTNIHPLSASESLAVLTLHGESEGPEPTRIHTAVRIVSAGYFEALGRRLVAGRALDERDDALGEPVVVVNRTFAERYLDEAAVGTLLPFDIEEREGWRVVGVVEDARAASLSADRHPRLFFARAQREWARRATVLSLLVRSRQAPERLAPVLRALVRERDAALVPDWIRPMDDLLADRLSRPRLYSTLVAAFAACALAVAGIGMFGVLSYAVAMRRREIGLRMALGARPGDVAALIGRRALALALAGLVAGLGLSLAGSRFLERLLWGVRPHDPVSVTAVSAVLALVAVLATALPALRAARLDPQRALRDD